MQGKFIVGLAGCTLLTAACSREPAQTGASTTVPASQAIEAKNPAFDVHIESFVVTPETIAKGQPVSVSVQLDKAPQHMIATLAWFGPDGWLVSDETVDVKNRSLSFRLQPGLLLEPGHYRAELRSGNVYLGEGALDVSG